MWVLEQKDKDEWRYIANDNNKTKYVVGRVSVDIVLPTDSSISRQHAIFCIEKNNKLYLEDTESKYGTYYNGRTVRMSAGEKTVISDGDTVRFGLFQNTWLIRQLNFNCLSSTLTATQQKALEAQLLKLGGRLEEKLHTQCTHLTMPECSLTPKLLYALIKNIPIVNCEYWVQLTLAVEGCKKLPKVEDYCPKADNVDLKPMAGRTQLFKGRIFIFMDEKTLDTYRPIIEATSGTLGELQPHNFKQQVLKPNVVVMEYFATSPSQNSQLFNEISAYLSNHGRRSIPDYEIAMAIMNCSTESWCNPDYLPTSTMPSLTEQQMQKCSEGSEEILVPETHEGFSNAKAQMESMSSMRVTETQTNNNEIAKRKREDFFNEDSDDAELGALNFEDFQVEMSSDTKRKSPSACTVVRPQTPPPMSERHNPIYVKGIPAVAALALANKKIRLLDEVELEKSALLTETATDMGKLNNNAVRKRPHISILTDDIDEENLFDFKKPTKRQKQRTPFINSESESEPMQSNENVTVAEHNKSIFNLISSTQESCRIADKRTTKSDCMQTPLPKAKKPFVLAMTTPKEIPECINIANWISCSKKKIKKEENDQCPIHIVTLDINQSFSNSSDTRIKGKIFKKFHCVPKNRVIIPTELRPINDPKF